jgi:hypothetical protein
MNANRRSFLAGSAAAAALASVPEAARSQSRTFTPEQFGARGDGVTNDSRAFARLAEAVSEAGGGTVEFRRTTYLVGDQVPVLAPGALYSWEPAKLLEIKGCSRPLVIRGNGARLRCPDGMRFGTFDAAGRRTDHPLPYTGPGVASPYRAMIHVMRCTAPVEIADFELDGNLPHLAIGGPYGDSGYQIPAIGLKLTDNSSDEIVRNIYAHHHAQDGMLIDGIDRVMSPMPRRLISNVRAEHNARQGCSITGGRGYSFEKCSFSHTGKGVIGSAPGAGVDIEAEGGKKNRDFRFTDCAFADNLGCGLVADTGDSEGAVFTRCTFIGTTSWAAWPFKPRFHFQSCRFIGAMVRAYGDKDPERATIFTDCTWLDDPKLSPTGKVYMGGKANYPIVDMSDSINVRFVRGTFNMTHNGLLPWSWYGIYQDCRMSQKAAVTAYPKGKYLGTSVVNGQVDPYGTNVIGVLILNGKRYEKVQLGGKSW